MCLGWLEPAVASSVARRPLEATRRFLCVIQSLLLIVAVLTAALLLEPVPDWKRVRFRRARSTGGPRREFLPLRAAPCPTACNILLSPGCNPWERVVAAVRRGRPERENRPGVRGRGGAVPRPLRVSGATPIQEAAYRGPGTPLRPWARGGALTARRRTQTIRVLHTEFHGRMLLLDEDVMLTERDEGVYHEMLAHVPLAYLPNVRRPAPPQPRRATNAEHVP